MEFKALKNIETAYQQLRRYSMAFLGLCALITVVAVWRSYSFAEKQRQKIYVLDNGKSLMLALSQDLWQNRPVEAREHVKRFHELFFTLAPDKAAIESNVNRAMMLADKSAIAYYRDLSEKGFFNRLIAGNVSQRIVVDSIAGNFLGQRSNISMARKKIHTYSATRIMAMPMPYSSTKKAKA